MYFLKKVAGLLAMAACLFLCLYSVVIGDTAHEERVTPWDRPVFQHGTWKLDGIVEGGFERRQFSWGQADLVQIRFGGGSFWALAGLTDQNGNYESWVKSAVDRDDLAEVFRQPRRVTLSVAGSPDQVRPKDCEILNSTRCGIISRIEKGNPDLLEVNGNSLYSTNRDVFIHSGSFPGHYSYGILTWDIESGEIIPQALEEY